MHSGVDFSFHLPEILRLAIDFHVCHIISSFTLDFSFRKHNWPPFYICTFSLDLSLKINIHWNWHLFRKLLWVLWQSTNEQINMINHNKEETVVSTHRENKTKLPQTPPTLSADTLLAPLNQMKPLNYQLHYSLAFCHYPHKCHHAICDYLRLDIHKSCMYEQFIAQYYSVAGTCCNLLIVCTW